MTQAIDDLDLVDIKVLTDEIARRYPYSLVVYRKFESRDDNSEVGVMYSGDSHILVGLAEHAKFIIFSNHAQHITDDDHEGEDEYGSTPS